MSILWRLAANARPAPTSLGTTVVLVANVTSVTIDTGITEGSVGILRLWAEDNTGLDHIHILFGATDPVGDPDHDGYIVEETQGGGPTVLFLITAKSQFFRMFSVQGRDTQYQVEEIQGE